MGFFIPLLFAGVALGAAGCSSGDSEAEKLFGSDGERPKEKTPTPAPTPPSPSSSSPAPGGPPEAMFPIDNNPCFKPEVFAKYRNFSQTKYIGVAVHIVKNSLGESSSFPGIQEDIEQNLNGLFAPMNYHFFLQSHELVQDDLIYSFWMAIRSDADQKKYDDFVIQHNVKGAINIYYGLAGAEGRFVLMKNPSDNHIFTDAYPEHDTSSHEMGHFLGLLHTFDGSPTATDGTSTDETKSDCLHKADWVCDTTPDPGTSHCKKSPDESITCDDPTYEPDCNVMSYYHCDDAFFSPDQTAIMNCNQEKFYPNLKIADRPPEEKDALPAVTVGCPETNSQKTIQDGANAIVINPFYAGQGTIEICEGTYKEDVKVDITGKTFDVTFRARPGHKVIIESSGQKPAFSIKSNSIWLEDPEVSQKVAFEDLTLTGGGIYSAPLRKTELKNVVIQGVDADTPQGGKFYALAVSGGGVHMSGGAILDCNGGESVVSLVGGQNVFENVQFSGNDDADTSNPFMGVLYLSGTGADLTLSGISGDNPAPNFVTIQSSSSGQTTFKTYKATDLADPAYCYSDGPPECVSNPRGNSGL